VEGTLRSTYKWVDPVIAYDSACLDANQNDQGEQKADRGSSPLLYRDVISGSRKRTMNQGKKASHEDRPKDE
jgi:hypothetical protein